MDNGKFSCSLMEIKYIPAHEKIVIISKNDEMWDILEFIIISKNDEMWDILERCIKATEINIFGTAYV